MAGRRASLGHLILMSKTIKVMFVGLLLLCSCGEAEQDTAHILRDCRNHQVLREEIWPMPESLHNKLYGPVAALQRTTNYISRSGLQV
ncbi:hypothetical protein V1264_002269 [Littorina saxatilis]|uniref:Uncharacterized protein n=1 Tax=Littorina saxatilis TaxID=31220 RepID=A0AAN9C3B6_9CAEN